MPTKKILLGTSVLFSSFMLSGCVTYLVAETFFTSAYIYQTIKDDKEQSNYKEQKELLAKIKPLIINNNRNSEISKETNYEPVPYSDDAPFAFPSIKIPPGKPEYKLNLSEAYDMCFYTENFEPLSVLVFYYKSKDALIKDSWRNDFWEIAKQTFKLDKNQVYFFTDHEVKTKSKNIYQRVYFNGVVSLITSIKGFYYFKDQNLTTGYVYFSKSSSEECPFFSKYFPR